jgi:hypothetical protein
MAARPVVYVLRAEICLSGVVLANRPLLGLATVDGEFVAIEIAAIAGICVRPESARTQQRPRPWRRDRVLLYERPPPPRG